MQKSYHANGKLLISAEYLVLKGALALAVPLNKGQGLRVSPWSQKGLQWRAYTPTGLWFEATFDNELNLISRSSEAHAKKLQNLLRQTVEQNPSVIPKLTNQQVTTYLEFDPLWGWGSSSTLLSLLAQWLQINPYTLLDATFGGSGYDLACATANGPLYYRREPHLDPEITNVPFNPKFMNQLGVVWLNQKQTSSTEVNRFLSGQTTNITLINEASTLTHEMATATDSVTFGRLIQQHEALISRATGQTPVQQRLFSDFKGNIKSLGAWGGDFVLYVSSDSLSNARSYFTSKGYNTLFPLAELLLPASPQKYL